MKARRLADPHMVARLVALACAFGGCAALFLGWRGAAGSLAVAVQLPFVVSGGMLGVALLVFGVAVFTAQLTRDEADADRRQLDELITRAQARLAERHEP
ncbi:MAG: hypothetical protein H0U92_10810 [Actinobacteria bacterium]|nr:hypothetical protein [Actinomycetota bacterium]